MPAKSSKKSTLNKQLQKIFTEKFLDADNCYNQQFKNQISHKDYLKKKAEFVKQWFASNCHNSIHPDDDQCAAIADLSPRTLIAARAGSGKTTTMVAKSLFLIRHCQVPALSIMLLAFNRNAVFTIRKRLFFQLASPEEVTSCKNELNSNGTGRWEDAEHILEQAISASSVTLPLILTFHSLAYRIVKPAGRFVQGNSSINPAILDQAVQSLYSGAEGRQFLLHFLYLGCTHFAEDFSPEYRRSPFRSLNGIALASSRDVHLANYLLTRNIPFLYTPPANSRTSGKFQIEGRQGYVDLHTATEELDLLYQSLKKNTGNTKSAELLTKIIHQKEVEIAGKNGIIISDIPEQLSSRISRTREESLQSLLREKLGYEPVRQDLFTIFQNAGYAYQRFCELAESFIVLAKNHGNDPQDVISRITSFNENRKQKQPAIQAFEFIMSRIYPLYEEIRSRSGQHDYLSIFPEAIKNLKSAHPLPQSLSVIIVDEFQDFTALYFNLIQTILELNSNIKLCCVGDDWQAINNYSGSDLVYFEKFAEYFKPATILNLPANYRSCSEIVDYSNLVNNRSGEQGRAIREDQGHLYLINAEELGIQSIQEEISLIALARLMKYPGETLAILTRTQYQLTSFNHLKKQFPGLILSTIHGFKGLEADTVIIDISGCYFENIHPDSPYFYSIGISSKRILEEEERLIYVGLTRAKNNLYLLYPNDDKRCACTCKVNTGSSSKEKLFRTDPYNPGDTMEMLAEFDESIKSRITVIANLEFDKNNDIKKLGYRYNATDKNWYKVYQSMEQFDTDLKKCSWYPFRNFSRNSLIIKNYRGEIVKRLTATTEEDNPRKKKK